MAHERASWPLAVPTFICGAVGSALTYRAEGDMWMWVVPVSAMPVWSRVMSPGSLAGSDRSSLGWGGFLGGLQICISLRDVR